MPHINQYLREISEREMSFLAQLTSEMCDGEIQRLAIAYRRKRKDPQTVPLMAVVGVVAVPGLHRFALGQIGMGLVYFFTWGLLLFGTITDIVRHEELAYSYNRQLAIRISTNLRHSGEPSAAKAEMAFA